MTKSNGRARRGQYQRKRVYMFGFLKRKFAKKNEIVDPTMAEAIPFKVVVNDIEWTIGTHERAVEALEDLDVLNDKTSDFMNSLYILDSIYPVDISNFREFRKYICSETGGVERFIKGKVVRSSDNVFNYSYKYPITNDKGEIIDKKILRKYIPIATAKVNGFDVAFHTYGLFSISPENGGDPVICVL